MDYYYPVSVLLEIDDSGQQQPDDATESELLPTASAEASEEGVGKEVQPLRPVVHTEGVSEGAPSEGEKNKSRNIEN